MTKRLKDLKLSIAPHALERWRLYIGPDKEDKIRDEVKRHLLATLQVGLPADLSVNREPGDWGFLLRLRPQLFAVVKPEVLGGWAVVTFHIGEIMKKREGREHGRL